MDEALAVSIAIQRVLADTVGTASMLIDERAIESVLRAIEQMGFIPAEEIGIALDVGAARIYHAGGYACADGTLDSDGWGERLARVVDAYPLSAIEDPLADAASLARLAPLVDHRVRVVGDDLFASDPERIAAAVADGSAAAVTLRPEAAGSLSELRAAFDTARLAAWPVLAAAAAGGEDTSLVHLATAWQASYIKLGGVGRGSSANANELLRIEAMLRRAPSAQRVEAAARLVH
jgi:enolase